MKYVILSPVGAYYTAGFSPVSIMVENHYVRAVPGGTGEAKTGGKVGEITRQLYDTLTGIQTGKREDTFGWIKFVD